MLVLSLGTGTGKHEEKYNATMASRWGMLGWVYNNGATPLIDIYGASRLTWVNLETGRYEPVAGEGTNEAALVRFAQRFRGKEAPNRQLRSALHPSP
ncbi:hypothetical protein HAX54_040215 [Datura stramonium]|uniref:Uncharacterized protein n=1 Tax=Datura stramonium TaxID=4076 RepID=A0ABS8SJQ5_DATST|nr:hypothetical protein [Datura stramonium]